MALANARTQYISIAEYAEIIGSGVVTDIQIQEASELLEYHMKNEQTFEVNDDNGYLASDNLKKATAYQVKYNSDNEGIDDGYASGNGSFTIGKFSDSESTGEVGATEYKKIAPAAQRYLILEGLICRQARVI